MRYNEGRNTMNYNYIREYKDNEALFRSFNELTKKTFCFNFYKWEKGGFWSKRYQPYSIADGDNVIANISVNTMKFELDGISKQYIQLGMVMTDPEYRGKGLSRFLMEKILAEYKETADGIYLFGNDSVIDFYPKFGFEKSKQYQYSKKVSQKNNVEKVRSVNLSNPDNWNQFYEVVKQAVSNSRFMMFNPELLAFYIMDSTIYYLEEEQTYIVAERNGQTLIINQLIANHEVELDDLIAAFGSWVNHVVLGFTPENTRGYECKELQIDDCTLFIMGADLKKIEEEKLMFPVLSHA